MHNKRPIGVHARIYTTFIDAVYSAQQLGMRAFQSFLSVNTYNQKLSISAQEIKKFIALKNEFDAIFFHASYYINPASCNISHHYLLEKEIMLAERLENPFLILHPGTASGCGEREKGIDALASTLNSMQGKYKDIIFVLENTAHDDFTIGGRIEDFSALMVKLDFPDRIRFCIDTAHAFSYGYDIRTQSEYFMQLVAKHVGIDKVSLLHINDTQEALGSKHDQHAILGQGNLGMAVLRDFASQESLKHIPIILELPELSQHEYLDLLNQIKLW